jgi:hypothetical protein
VRRRGRHDRALCLPIHAQIAATETACGLRPATAKRRSRGREDDPSTSIADEGEPGEAEQHHRPDRGLGDSACAKGSDALFCRIVHLEAVGDPIA